MLRYGLGLNNQVGPKNHSLTGLYSNKSHLGGKNQENIELNLNGNNLKKTFSTNPLDQHDFFLQKIDLSIFFFINLWVKYEPVWTYFTAQTVVFSAYLLVQSQTIP